jgi:hypothetical protein
LRSVNVRSAPGVDRVLSCRTSTSGASKSNDPEYTAVEGSPASDPYRGLTSGSVRSRSPAHG